jgi:hypothetical protein
VLRGNHWFGSFSLCLLLAAVGCSQSSAVKVAPADGTVTLSKAPLAGARVTIIPEKGPVALCITGNDGKFKVSSVSVGPVKVAISVESSEDSSDFAKDVSQRPKTDAEAQAYLKKASELQKQMIDNAKSGKNDKPAQLIPAKYSKAETSGLSYTVKENGDNHFKIEL